jgi:TetR/AcrR family transcriptional regulator, lmrAB and yxaGH operons repressor
MEFLRLAASLTRTLCVRRQLATADVGATARQSLQRALQHWIRAIEGPARESGI